VGAPRAKIEADSGRVRTRRIRGRGVGDQGADGSAADGQGCRSEALVPHANGDVRVAVPQLTEAEEQEAARLLGQLARVEERQKPPLPADDRRSRRATLKTWLREHTPLIYATMYDDRLLERLRRAELDRLDRIRRGALAYCIECRNPLLATERGFQFCPYARAGQHPKVKAALDAKASINVRVRADMSHAAAPRLTSVPPKQSQLSSQLTTQSCQSTSKVR
jgi:hypothetical protein